MELITAWEEKLLEKEFQKEAYGRAFDLYNSYNKKFGSSSYFRSLSNRILDIRNKEANNIIEFFKEESKRGSASAYWEEKGNNNISLLNNVSDLINIDFSQFIREKVEGYTVSISDLKFEKHLIKLLSYFFEILGDFIAMGERNHEEK